MKFDPEVKKENIKMALGCFVCSAVVAAVFAVIGKFDLAVLIGALIGWVASYGNFYLMSVGVIKALETGDEVTAKLKMRSSYILRTVALIAIIGASVYFDFINWIPVVLSVFYPRVVITACSIFSTLKNRNAPAPEMKDRAADAATPEEVETDEFEKFVSGFSRGKVPGEDINKDTDK